MSFAFDAANYGIFARIEKSEFTRALSNIINNAGQALSNGGVITVTLSQKGAFAEVVVCDTGVGIHPDKLQHLGKKQTSFRDGGSGLGLYSARTAVETWSGNLSIESELGKWTRVTLRIPVCEAPKWFVPNLEFKRSQTIVVLDDDSTVHDGWAMRLKPYMENSHALKLVTMTTPEEFRNWVAENGLPDNTIYLFDCELDGSADTGLDLIKDFEIAKKSVLVTSAFYEKHIQDCCEHHGIKLLPKVLMHHVPIEAAS